MSKDLYSHAGGKVQYVFETVQVLSRVELSLRNGEVYYDYLDTPEIIYETARPYLVDGEMMVRDEYGNDYKISECQWEEVEE